MAAGAQDLEVGWVITATVGNAGDVVELGHVFGKWRAVERATLQGVAAGIALCRQDVDKVFLAQSAVTLETHHVLVLRGHTLTKPATPAIEFPVLALVDAVAHGALVGQARRTE